MDSNRFVPAGLHGLTPTLGLEFEQTTEEAS